MVQRTEGDTEEAFRYAEDGSANSQAKQRDDGEPKHISITHTKLVPKQLMCQLAMRTCTNTIPAPLPLANLLLYLMDTNLHRSLLNLCSIFTQPFVCRDIEPTLATRNNTCSTLQTVQRKDAACSKQQNPAYCQSACPFSVGTTHAPTLQLYSVHTKDGATTVLDSVVRRANQFHCPRNWL